MDKNPQSILYADRREVADLMLIRMDWLSPEDRVLMRLVYEHGVRPVDIATLKGCTLRTVQRQIVKLTKRLLDPFTVFILRNHTKWSESLQNTALLVVVRGHTLRDVATVLDTNLYGIRLNIEMIRTLFKAYKNEN